MQTNNSLIHLNYNETIVVDFNGDGWFNATIAAKQFDKRPSDWLVLDDTQKYVSELKKQIPSKTTLDRNQLVTTRKGSPENGGGTWLHPKLAVAFARWLNVEFSVWCDLQIDNIVNEKNQDNLYDAALKAMKFFPIAQKVAKGLGLDKNETILAANKAVFILTKVNTLHLLGHDGLVSESQKVWRSVTDIGKLIGQSAQATNKLLESAGLQEKVLDTWVASEKAEGYYRLFDSGKKHNNGASIQQLKWCDDVVELIKDRIQEPSAPYLVQHLEVVQ